MRADPAPPHRVLGHAGPVGVRVVPLRLTKLEFQRLKRGPVGLLRMGPGAIAGRRWETEFESQLREARIIHVRELVFAPPRKWRFDFAFPAEQIALEIDGAVHRIKSRFNSDRDKGNAALLAGWRVLHVTPAQVRSGEALALLCKLICVSPAL